MRFGQIHYANLFWLVAGVIVFCVWAFRRKRKMLNRFAAPNTLEEIASGVDLRRQKIKYTITILVLILSVFSLMRPQWGFRWQDVKRKGLDILIAVDTSKSMLAADIKPNRLGRAKLAVRDLAGKVKGDRIGLIAFAGEAYLQCPLTIDYNGFLLALSDLDTGTIPRGGSSLSAAIKEALAAYGSERKGYQVLVIVTDGEYHSGNPLKWAKEAEERGVKIFCIGVGTRKGELITVRGKEGKKEFLKNEEGNVVKSRLNENVLQKIASITSGAYVKATGARFGLNYIYENNIARMQKKEFESRRKKDYHQRYQIPLALALLFLLANLFLSDKKRYEP